MNRSVRLSVVGLVGRSLGWLVDLTLCHKREKFYFHATPIIIKSPIKLAKHFSTHLPIICAVQNFCGFDVYQLKFRHEIVKYQCTQALSLEEIS